MFLIYHPVHAATMPRSCSSVEEFKELEKQGWYTEGELPSPIPPGDIPPTNADEASKPSSPVSKGNAGAREEEKVANEDDPSKDNEPVLLVTDLNVADAKTVIESTFELDVLKAIEKEENKHKQRVGVFSAIDAQRDLIKNTEPADPSKT